MLTTIPTPGHHVEILTPEGVEYVPLVAVELLIRPGRGAELAGVIIEHEGEERCIADIDGEHGGGVFIVLGIVAPTPAAS
jgi:hypothetical protein